MPDMATVTEGLEGTVPLYTAEALATARAEGRAEGMREAANQAKWFGGEANMLQNDNVDPELNVARRDAAYKIERRILAAIPVPAVSP